MIRPRRESLPAKRRSINRTITVNSRTVHYTVGFYDDGRPGELWIDVAKSGTALRAWAGSTAKLISLMLQYGVPLQEIVDALAGDQSEPEPIVEVRRHEEITEATGILDAIVRSMALEHLARDIYDRLDHETGDSR